MEGVGLEPALAREQRQEGRLQQIVPVSRARSD